jgi:hypothetical protein
MADANGCGGGSSLNYNQPGKLAKTRATCPGGAAPSA